MRSTYCNSYENVKLDHEHITLANAFEIITLKKKIINKKINCILPLGRGGIIICICCVGLSSKEIILLSISRWDKSQCLFFAYI